MPSKRISEFDSGDGTAQAADTLLVARSGANYKFTLSQIGALSAPLVAPFYQGVLNYIPITEFSGNSALQNSGDIVYNIFYVFQPCIVTHVIVKHQSAVGNIDVGIYSDTGSGPGTKLASSGSVAAADFIALASPVTLQPGKYWVAETGNNGGRRIYYQTTLAPPNSTTKIWYGENAFPLPATATPGVNTHTVMYQVYAGSFG